MAQGPPCLPGPGPAPPGESSGPGPLCMNCPWSPAKCQIWDGSPLWVCGVPVQESGSRAPAPGAPADEAGVRSCADCW
eukprot:9945263-Heterocapsa_arctica.AAC.1